MIDRTANGDTGTFRDVLVCAIDPEKRDAQHTSFLRCGSAGTIARWPRPLAPAAYNDLVLWDTRVRASLLGWAHSPKRRSNVAAATCDGARHDFVSLTNEGKQANLIFWYATANNHGFRTKPLKKGAADDVTGE